MVDATVVDATVGDVTPGDVTPGARFRSVVGEADDVLLIRDAAPLPSSD